MREWAKKNAFPVATLILVPVFTALLSYFAQRAAVREELQIRERELAVETLSSATRILSDNPENEKVKEIAEKWILEVQRANADMSDAAETFALYQAVREQLDETLCIKPPSSFLEKSKPLRELESDLEDGGFSMRAVLIKWAEDIYAYEELAIRHDALVDVLEASCGNWSKPNEGTDQPE